MTCWKAGKAGSEASIPSSPATPQREVYNLGNKDPVTVTYMIECLEFLGKYQSTSPHLGLMGDKVGKVDNT